MYEADEDAVYDEEYTIDLSELKSTVSFPHLPENTKTMLKDKFSVWIHAIAEPGESSVMIYDMIQKLQEAMTEDIVLPEGFELILQMDGGVQTIKKDETKEKHAVLLYEFTVCYGFKCKI